MSEEDLKRAVIARYAQVYPYWRELRVTTLVPDVFGRSLAVVKALDKDGAPTEGEICFVTGDGKVTIFQTTEDLAAALMPELPADPKMIEEAKNEIASFGAQIRQRHGTNWAASSGLVASGILLSIGVTAAGFFGPGWLAGALGLIVTLFIALQNAFFFSEKAEFQRVVFTEAENLLSLLKFRVRSPAQFDSVIDAFMTLKKSGATGLPHGKGMQVVKEMYGSAPQGLRDKV